MRTLPATRLQPQPQPKPVFATATAAYASTDAAVRARGIDDRQARAPVEFSYSTTSSYKSLFGSRFRVQPQP